MLLGDIGNVKDLEGRKPEQVQTVLGTLHNLAPEISQPLLHGKLHVSPNVKINAKFARCKMQNAKCYFKMQNEERPIHSIVDNFDAMV